MSETLDEFMGLCKEAIEAKKIVEEIEQQKKDANAKLTRIKSQLLKIMETSELEKQQVPGFGTISRRKKFSVTTPKSPEAKVKVFNYIKERYGKEVLMDYTTINSNKLNSFWKQEHALAVEAGDIDWQMDGVDEPKVYYDIGITK